MSPPTTYGSFQAYLDLVWEGDGSSNYTPKIPEDSA